MNGNNLMMKFIQIFIILARGTEEVTLVNSLLNTKYDTIADAGIVLLITAEFTEMIVQSTVIRIPVDSIIPISLG